MTRMPSPFVLSLLVTVSAWSASAGQSQTTAVGSEFQVNSYTTSFQVSPAVASDRLGNFLVIWSSNGSVGNDSSNSSIQGQRYDAAGTPVGAQFQVNSYTTNNQVFLDIASTADDGFVVVWQSNGSSGTDSLGYSIQAQRYDAAGTSIGAQFQVNSYTTDNQTYPAVASDSDGDFVIVWHSTGSTSDMSGSSIQGQRYDAVGTPVGDQFQVNSYTTNNQSHAAVTTDPTGQFVVVWESLVSNSTDPLGYSIQAQRYDAAGTPIGAQFLVNSYTTGIQRFPAVAAGPDGRFTVIWESYGSSSTDTSFRSIQGQRYGADGTSIGAQFQVNSYTGDDQLRPAVAIDGDGDFVVTWVSYGSSGTDTTMRSIQGKRYDVAGDPIGTQFQVNSYTTGNQWRTAVAADPNGDFAIAWESAGSSGTDTSGSSIQAQRYRVTGDVGDRVFFDRDFDGIQGAGETGVAGVPVHLFDSFATLVRSTATDASGLYHFKPKPGQYYLQFELPSNQSFTPRDRGGDDGADSDADVLTGETDSFEVALLSNDLDRDAGMANGIGDRVWLDANGNGIQDGGEGGVVGVGVALFDELGSPVASTFTGAGGRYSFVDLVPGVYYVAVTPPTSSTFTLQDATFDDRDSDVGPSTGTTPLFTFAPGDLDVSWDAGIITGVDIGDRVWLDDNGNGIQDGGESGASGVTVQLRDAGGTLADDPDTTDAAGSYGFTATPGSYYLEVILPAGLAFAPRDRGVSDGADSDVEPTTGTTVLFTLGAGGPDLSWDAGLEPAVLGNQVWLDRNGNGLQDAGEPGVAGVLVRLLDGSGSELQTTTTDSQGRYAFAGLAAGTYEVEFAPPAGWAFTAAKQGSDPLRDSDADVTTGRTGTIGYTASSAARFLDAGLLEVPIFVDGFESGNTSAWGAVVP